MPVTLSDVLRRSKAVLIFYVLDFTLGWYLQLAAVRGDAPLFYAAGAEVFGINGASVRSHRGFAKLHGFTARLLSDRGLRVSKAYDAVTSFGPFHVIDRTVVGVDRSGRIVFYERGMPSTSEILAGLASTNTERTAT